MNNFLSLTPIQYKLYRHLYKKSFYDFAKDFWQEADPAKFVDGKLIQFYCEVFQYMCRGWVGYDELETEPILPPYNEDINIIDVRNGKHNICINIPPRHSKSMILNVLAGTWIWINEPIKMASVSHTQDLAGTMNSKRQKVINSDRYKYFFPEILLETNTASSLKDSRGGELYSINRNAMTGYGADIIVADDLSNAESARKDKEEMNNCWAFFQNTLPSRINDPTKYVILNVQQRLAPNDVTGRIMNNSTLSDQYEFIVLPAQFEKDTYIVCPISGDVLVWKKGEYLWPERFGDYKGLKAQVGDTVWETQYLQHPVATDKTLVKEEMLREEDCTAVPGWDISNNCIDQLNVDMIYASHDFPVKDKVTSDFLGSILAYRIKKTLYIIDCQELKQNFTKSLQFVKDKEAMYPGIVQVIEDKANGSPLMNMLQEEVAGMHAFQTGTNSKEERLSYASTFIDAGNVVFVKTKLNKQNNKWQLSENMQNLKSRLLNFPFVEHDDIVDALSMLVMFVFMDVRYSVYGRSFNDLNVVNKNNLKYDYSTTFFNKEGDTWKALDIGIKYGLKSELIILNETMFKASIEDGLKLLKSFTPDKNVFIDSSLGESLTGIYNKEVIVEKYNCDNFEKSVTDLGYAFAQNKVLIDSHCKLTQADIENFKFDKKDKSRFVTDKDGFIACIRVAMKYYGGI